MGKKKTSRKKSGRPKKGQIVRKELVQTGMAKVRTDTYRRKERKTIVLDHNAPIESIKGIGPVKGKALRKEGIKQVMDPAILGTGRGGSKEEIAKRERIKKILRGVRPVPGKIDRKELRQVGLATKTGRIDDGAPVEAVKGIGPKRGKELRARGIRTASLYEYDLYKKQQKRKGK